MTEEVYKYEGNTFVKKDFTTKMVPSKYHKLQYNDKKIIIFNAECLNKKAYWNLHSDYIKVLDIRFEDIHCAYRDFATKQLDKGYSIIFTDKGKSKILKYNS